MVARGVGLQRRPSARPSRSRPALTRACGVAGNVRRLRSRTAPHDEWSSDVQTTAPGCLTPQAVMCEQGEHQTRVVDGGLAGGGEAESRARLPDRTSRRPPWRGGRLGPGAPGRARKAGQPVPATSCRSPRRRVSSGLSRTPGSAEAGAATPSGETRITCPSHAAESRPHPGPGQPRPARAPADRPAAASTCRRGSQRGGRPRLPNPAAAVVRAAPHARRICDARRAAGAGGPRVDSPEIVGLRAIQ